MGKTKLLGTIGAASMMLLAGLMTTASAIPGIVVDVRLHSSEAKCVD